MISPAYGLALEANATNIQALADCYGPWVGIRSNHVITRTNKFSGSDGSSRSISTEADRALLVALRSSADVIIVDAETARREQYQLPSSGAALAIFSQSGKFSGIPALDEDSKLCFLFSPTAPKDFERHRHVPIASPESPLQDLSKWADSRGFRSMLLEAGPTLSRTAFDNQLVSQSALTISESDLVLDSILGTHPFDPSATLLSVAHSEGASFTYWGH